MCARLRPDFNALACALTGLGSVGGRNNVPRAWDSSPYTGGCDMVTGATDAGQDSCSPQLEMLVLGGESPREPVAVYGPFAKNTRQELYKASVDYGPGRRRSSPSALRRSVVRAVSCSGWRSPGHELRA
ncbi:pirin-like C-terminal cupin domain-containing protein [Streptomyces sp. Ncost-T10-10d]|uniref:pirin-like C-terminal cupin domain-containing protein n=1 Tax=Streptomyces sp. Ncost-T10-10d TaxID=1839774 RepID=UPI00081D3E30|nr:hypothetical protein GA0115254_126833 [Streptomyces sp. Ncost-T10-10d]